MPLVAERPEVPVQVETYRVKYRAEALGPWYSGILHLGTTSFGSLATILFAARQVRAPSLKEWLMVPATFLIANLVEFLMHRGPLHHPQPVFEIYKRHTLEHHSFYTHEAMIARSTQDFKMVLFPPAAIVLFLGVIGAPIGALFYFLVSPNAGWLYVATAVSYFLTYEWLHLAYHLPPESPVGKLPFMAALRRHHTVHHDPERMAHWNFNITFPIFDAVFRTSWKA